MRLKLLLVVPIVLFLSGCIETVDKAGNLITPSPTPFEVSENLIIEDIETGEGEEATPGKTVRVHYTGTLEDGTEFDSSRNEGRQPFEFTLGAGQVIPGWEQGVQGMKVGGKRQLTVPPELAYGEEGAGGTIPANATLTFEIELLAIIKN